MEFLNFLKQLGFALAGASALWGWIFCRRKHEDVAAKMLPLFFGGLIVGTISWLILFWREVGNTLAHEGISITPLVDASIRAKFIQAPILLAAIIVALVFILRRKPDTTPRSSSATKWFFVVEFFLMSVVISLLGWVGEINREQLFLFSHGFHSIMTLGTVLTVDYLFFISRRSLSQKQAIYPMFPLMSKVIWLGLGIDFASAALIYEQAVKFTSQFYFVQAVVGILIINGVILSGPLTRRLLDNIRRGVAVLPKKLNLIAGICGSISVTSWLTITFVDQFSDIHLAYGQFVAYYIIAIGIIFALKILAEKTMRWFHGSRE